MIIEETAGGRGKVVQVNMTVLGALLAIGAGTMQVAEDIFEDNDVVTIGEEDILITAAGPTCTITRAQNGTAAAAHPAGQEVQKSPGAVLASKTFNGSTYLSMLRASGNAAARFGYAIDGVLKYQEPTSYVELGKPLPCVQHKPANGVTYTIYAWVKASEVAEVGGEAVCWAIIQSY